MSQEASDDVVEVAFIEGKLKQLKRSRSGHKSYSTRIGKETEGLIQNAMDGDTAIENDIRVNKLIITEKLATLKELDREILDLITEDEEFGKQFEVSSNYQRDLLKVLVAIEQWEEGKEKKTVKSSGRETPGTSQAKLPKLTLKKFNGDPLLFQSFWDSFESAVNKNTSLDDITKFNYLKGLLEDKASLVLQGLTLTSDNYRNAIALLKERFGDPQVVITAHMDALLAISPVTSDKVSELREICDIIEVHTRNLQLFQICANNYGPVLISIIMSKLPAQIKLEISRQMPQGKWDINQLMEALKKEIMSRERCASDEDPRHSPGHTEQLSSTLHSQSRNWKNNKGMISCTFCGKPHQSALCRKISSVEERKSVLRSKNRCYICLKANHIASKCYLKRTCKSCDGRHHEAICHNNEKKEHSDGETSLTCNASNGQVNKCTLLQTAKAVVNERNSSDNSSQTIRVLFDNCSQKSFITSKLRNRLKLPTLKTEVLKVKAFASTVAKVEKVDVVNLKVRNCKNTSSNIIQVYVVPVICSPIDNQCINFAKEKYDVLKEIELADGDVNGSTTKDVDVLVGADHYWDFVTGRIIRVDGLTAVHTTLGWVLNGNIITPRNTTAMTSLATTTHVLKVEAESSLESKFEQFWHIEGVGSDEHDVFNSESFIGEITFNGKHYSVPLPWKKSFDSTLPNNYFQSKKRLFALLERLRGQPKILRQYDDVIKQQEKENIIERCEDFRPGVNAHYLPHRCVINEDKKTTKLRVVYDASSNKPSLNDCLEKGPCLLPLLLDVMIRFRSYKVALVSDIKQAFLNVGVHEGDRDFMRFLWVKDVNEPNSEMIVYRFTRVLFGMKPSSYLLAATILKHLRSYPATYKAMVDYILRSFYVDDNVGGAGDKNDALRKYMMLKNIFSTAGFDLKEWRSNDPEVQMKIDAHETQITSVERPHSESDKHKTLGLQWDTNNDSVHISTNEIYEQAKEIVISKRNVLKMISSIYDPLGLISPIMIMFKEFFQKLCENKLNWDDELNDVLKNEWLKLISFLSDDRFFKVNRYYFDTYLLKDVRGITLHGFCDASAKAYAAVVYITGEVTGGRRVSEIVVCKTKVSPLKKLSIPRLELCACLLLSNLLENVQNALRDVVDVKYVYYWSDSLDALFWIKEESRRRNVFIENRVQKIRKKVASVNWRHCPTELNPADVPSRGMKSLKNMRQDYGKWIAGPEFIRKDKMCWPDDKSVSQHKSNDDVTAKNCMEDGRVMMTTSEVDVVSSCDTQKFTCLHTSDDVTNKKKSMLYDFDDVDMDKLINIESYNCLKKLLRVTAYVVRFLRNFQHKIKSEDLIKGYLTCDEIDNAEQLWTKSVQKCYKTKSKQLNNTLGLQINTCGIITCKGRLQNSDLSQNQKNPILIPGNTHFARLLVQDAHYDTLHGGKKDTIIQLRSKYWVTKAKKLINSVVRKCAFPCNRLEGKAFKSMESSQLPAFRVQRCFPFANTGVDYLGPLHVRQVFDEGDTSMHKVEVVLYTCAVTRAVHLDLVPDLSAAAFLRSLKRFIGRRGIPSLMISDNATCFRNEEVRLSEELLNMGVKWKFIIAASPWWGGFWERLVQTVKRSLHKVLFRASVNYEELLTIIIEIEGVINSRPITYIYNDEVDEILTPAHLLLGRRLLSKFDEPIDQEEENGNVQLTKRMKYVKLLADHYWQRFTDEYLLELRARHIQGENPVRKPDIGEIVVIQGKTKRNHWRLGKIVRFIPSKDGNVRAVVLKVFDGTNIRYIKRPIERLHPIEVKSVCDVSNDEIENSKIVFDEIEKVDDVNKSYENRPRREAADNGILIRRLLGHL